MNNIATANNIKFSLNSLENSSGVISAPVPNIKNEFTMHEPIRFPIAKPPSALTTAITAVIISGKAVPIATIVNPITLWLNPKIFASSLASSTTRSPPNFNRTTPIIINTIESKTLILDFSLLLFSSLSPPFLYVVHRNTWVKKKTKNRRQERPAFYRLFSFILCD